jgi:hypothetical protein
MPDKRIGCWVEHEVVAPHVIADLLETCPAVPRAGLREPLTFWPDAVSILEPARSIASGFLGGTARVTRAILFDKPPGRNWSLEVHQDTTVALAEKVDSTRFGPWSMKEGVWHAEAPDGIIEMQTHSHHSIATVAF